MDNLVSCMTESRFAVDLGDFPIHFLWDGSKIESTLNVELKCGKLANFEVIDDKSYTYYHIEFIMHISVCVVLIYSKQKANNPWTFLKLAKLEKCLWQFACFDVRCEWTKDSDTWHLAKKFKAFKFEQSDILLIALQYLKEWDILRDSKRELHTELLAAVWHPSRRTHWPDTVA